MSATPDKIDQLVDAVAQLAGVVAGLAERVEQIDSGASSPATTSGIPEGWTISDQNGYSELIAPEDPNASDRTVRDRRLRLIERLNYMGDPVAKIIMEVGARGFYRDNTDFCANEQARWMNQLLVEDAALEDTLEAQDMGRHLLKVIADVTDVTSGIDVNTDLALHPGA